MISRLQTKHAVFCVVSSIWLIGACTQGSASPAGQGLNKVPARELFILPAGYSGPFMANYGQSKGVHPTWRGETSTILLGADGIVRIAYPEPPHRTVTSFTFVDDPARPVRQYPTCADMRVHAQRASSGVCWLDFVMGSSGPTATPEHVIAVVTDWAGIPENYERTTFVYDSVLYDGRSTEAWVEPPDLRLKQKARSGGEL